VSKNYRGRMTGRSTAKGTSVGVLSLTDYPPVSLDDGPAWAMMMLKLKYLGSESGYSFNKRLELIESVKAFIVGTLRGYMSKGGDFDDFKGKWKYLRTGLPLQGRLLFEQTFYDLGSPWRYLVSGFSPL